MSASVVQTNSAAQNTGQATVAATWTSPATAGNLLLIAVASDDYRTAGGIPSGFTESTGCNLQTFHGLYLWWKVAAGGETSASYTIASASTSVWATAEVSGLDSIAPYDVSLGQLAQTAGISYTTQNLAPSAGERFLVAVIGGSSSAGNFTGLSAWLNSFVQAAVATNTKASGTRDIAGMATSSVTGDGTTTFSSGATYSQSATARTGIIIAFKVAAAGGTTQNATATLAATASLSVGAPKTTLPATALTVSATLTAAATDSISPAAALAATATLTVAAADTIAAGAALAAAATLTPAATDTIAAGVSLPVTATLSTTLTTGAAPKLADATLAVTATFNTAATRTALAAASLDAIATLTAGLSESSSAAAAVAVVAALMPGAAGLYQVGAVLAVTAALVATASAAPATTPGSMSLATAAARLTSSTSGGDA